MTKSVKIIMFNFLAKIHFPFLKYELSTEMKSFVGNMGYAGISSLISGAMLAIVQILAVRSLGPTEYGKVSLVFALANFLPYFMFMGLQSGLVKYLPEKKEVNQKGIIITTSLLGILLFTCLSLVVAIFLRNFILNLFDLTLSIFYVSLIYSTFTVLKTATESILKGLLNFKMQAILDIAYTGVAAVFFILLYLLGYGNSYLIYILAFVLGLLIYVSIVLIKYKRFIKFYFWNYDSFKSLLSYGFFSVLGSVALFVLWGSDRFFLNKFLDVKSVGIYSVYYGTSLIVLGRFSSILLKVLFPTASGRTDKCEINKRLGKLMLIGFLPILVANCALMYIMMLIYGKEYPLKPDWILLFSVNAILYTYIGARGVLVVSQGVKGYAYYSTWSIIMAVLAFMLYLLAIPTFGVIGAIITVTLVSLIFFVGLSIYSKIILDKKHQTT